MQTGELQASGFVQAKHTVHRLHAISSTALDQVIEGADDDQTITMGIDFKTYIAEIRASRGSSVLDSDRPRVGLSRYA